MIKSEDSYRKSINVEPSKSKDAENPYTDNISKPVEKNPPSHVPRQATISDNQMKALSSRQSKDKIKIFKDEDDSDVEKHLIESRKRLKDPMDNDASDESDHPTPEKTSAKAVLRTTEESAAISEGALNDAQAYLTGIYDKNKSKAIRQEPFSYPNDKDLILTANGKEDHNLGMLLSLFSYFKLPITDGYNYRHERLVFKVKCVR